MRNNCWIQIKIQSWLSYFITLWHTLSIWKVISSCNPLPVGPHLQMMSKSYQQTYPNSLLTWLIDLPPWVTDMPSRGHHNGRVMREWWDLSTACSARPFACEVGCQREQDLSVVGPTAPGLFGDEPQTTGNWRFSIKQPCRTVTSFGMASEWKIKTIKQKSIVSRLRVFKHL